MVGVAVAALAVPPTLAAVGGGSSSGASSAARRVALLDPPAPHADDGVKEGRRQAGRQSGCPSWVCVIGQPGRHISPYAAAP